MKLTEKRFKYTFFTSIFVGLAAHLFALTMYCRITIISHRHQWVLEQVLHQEGG